MATKTAQKPAARAPAPQQKGSTRPPQQEQRAPSREVARAGGTSNLPAGLAKRVAEDAGKGVSTKQEDNLVPLIYVLQPLSPQCLRGDPKQIKGAVPGDIWLRNAPEEIQVQHSEDDQGGIIFQHCYFSKDWVEWMPNRGGFAGRHPVRPAEAEQREEEAEDGTIRKVWRLENGNSVVETRYHVGYVHVPDRTPLPYTIPLTSTGHTVSKAWMFAMNGEQLPDGGGTMPAFALLWHLTTELKTKNNKSWFMLKVTKHGYVESEEDYDRGLALHDAFSIGAKDIEAEGDEVDSPSTAGTAGESGDERDDAM